MLAYVMRLLSMLLAYVWVWLWMPGLKSMTFDTPGWGWALALVLIPFTVLMAAGCIATNQRSPK